ncbi:MAG: Gfo/Idh/MocA family oxidoreductase [Clostridia bacterium]|nr:Gfo/Idh/MocA family oxidoreductase [Clostridia bacterium]
MAYTIKLGMFGAWRGSNYIDLIAAEDPDVIKIVAVCDKQSKKLDDVKGLKDAKLFSDFDEFLQYGKSVGMNAVFLANYFHQHAPFAIKCMEAGMDVVSECTSASTLKECVELVRCVERTDRKYMIAENYPFMTLNLEMKRIADGGTLGTFLYAEGEYNHSGTLETMHYLTPFKYHWRAWMPRTYYVTHAMGPLMYMTNSMPKYVSARAAHSKRLEEVRDFRPNDDGMARMFCEMDNGMTASFTGCTAMASDYSRYRLVGDLGSVEQSGYTNDKVRLFYEDYTLPEGVTEEVQYIEPDLSYWGEKAEKALSAGHGGGDYWIMQNMIDYFANGVVPFFDVYKGVAMSATAILGWRSCLNHGENYKIPDFTKEEDREAVENDDLTPFPDENGEGATLPPSLMYGKYDN